MSNGEEVMITVIAMMTKHLKNQKDFAINFTFLSDNGLKVSCLVDENQEIENLEKIKEEQGE